MAKTETRSHLKEEELQAAVTRLVSVVAQLRDPETGCPWDLKQTHQSLKPYMLEESYEAVEAIHSGDPSALKEELGDVLLQVMLHSQLAQESGTFNFAEVCTEITEKLIRRHPHVFGDVTVTNAEAVTQNWDIIKQQEKQQKKETLSQGSVESVLAGVSPNMPALTRAFKISKKAVKVGFKWPSVESLWSCVMSEFDEFQQELEGEAQAERLEEELGDILFATTNLAREFHIDPEVALSHATEKFIQRFQHMEATVQHHPNPKPLETLSFEEWDTLWNQAKQLQKDES